nr:heme NO-binding domain-containing protein [Clostridium cadaveris]
MYNCFIVYCERVKLIVTKGKDFFNWIGIGRNLYGDEVINESIKAYKYEDIIIQIENQNKKIMCDIVHNISDLTDKSEDEIWKEFGKEFLDNLQERYPGYFTCDNIYMFLKSLNDILKYIWKKMKYIYIGELDIVEISKKQARVTFTSNIGYVDLFYGILEGCEGYFNERLYIKEIEKTYEVLILDIEFPYDIYNEYRYAINSTLYFGCINLIEGKISLIVFFLSLLINGCLSNFKVAAISSILISILTFTILNILLRPKRFLKKEICKLNEKKYYDNVSIKTHDQFEELNNILREFKLKERNSIIEYKGISDDMHRFINNMNSGYESIKNTANGISNIITLIAKRVDENVIRTEVATKTLNKNVAVLKSMIDLENINKSEMEKYVEKSFKSYESIECFNKNMESALKKFREVNNKGVEIKDRIKNITQIANMVDNIAEQVNLLSLNASIKAARSGEDGKDFIVILDSLRRLAEQSRIAARDINSNLYKFTSDVSMLIVSVNQQYKFWEDEVKRLYEIKNMNYESTLCMQNISETIIRNINDLDREYKHIEKIGGIVNEMAFVAKINYVSAKEVKNSINVYNERIEDLKNFIEGFKETSKVFSECTDAYKI